MSADTLHLLCNGLAAGETGNSITVAARLLLAAAGTIALAAHTILNT